MRLLAANGARVTTSGPSLFSCRACASPSLAPQRRGDQPLGRNRVGRPWPHALPNSSAQPIAQVSSDFIWGLDPCNRLKTYKRSKRVAESSVVMAKLTTTTAMKLRQKVTMAS